MAPGEGSGTHAVSPSLGDLSAAGSRPLGVCECEPPIARNLSPGGAPCAPLAQGSAGTSGGEAAGREEEGWG